MDCYHRWHFPHLGGGLLHTLMSSWDSLTSAQSSFVDTAAPSQASLDHVYLRAMQAEGIVALGGIVLELFWELKGFYDSIDLEVLFSECRLAGFPLRYYQHCLFPTSCP